ncbi:hypothetical protein [Haladaptatus sp. DFWS20]
MTCAAYTHWFAALEPRAVCQNFSADLKAWGRILSVADGNLSAPLRAPED